MSSHTPRTRRGSNRQLHQDNSNGRPRRGFNEIPMREAGYQGGKQRFPETARDRKPHINSWRHNLTALSQKHNLYFIACQSALHIYRPRYPDQRLDDGPVAILHLPVLHPGAPGHMVSSDPHGVNNLLIANLGEQEIFLVACDDGDVIAHYTDSILECVESYNRGMFDWKEPLELQNWTPFFHVNVGWSAWGLAVHTEARLIAVSANSWNVTVFAFALTPEDEFKNTVRRSTMSVPTTNILHGEWPEITDLAHCMQELSSPTPSVHSRNSCFRSKNFKRTLVGHRGNVPCVAFCNTQGDREATTLVSGDITGMTIVWDLRTSKQIVSFSSLSRTPLHFDHDISGWGLAFIEPRAFAKADSLIDAMGVCEKIYGRPGCALDITHSKFMVQNASETMVIPNKRTTAITEDFMHVDDGEEDDDDEDDFGEDYEDSDGDDVDFDVHFQHPGNVTYTSFPPITVTSPQPVLTGVDMAKTPISQSIQIDHDRFVQQLYAENKQRRIPMRKLGQEYTPPIDASDVDFKIFSLAPTNNFSARQPVQELGSLPRVPLVLMNPRSLHLFQTPNFYERGESAPIITAEDPLSQKTPEYLQNSMELADRLNLHVQIPELGVLLVGSPKGRVALLTLHQLPENPFGAAKGPLFTMRLDHLLPFGEQEKEGKRPLHRLVGLAASPLQGSKRSDGGSARWRVMLLYREHTVLSYELARSVAGGLEVAALGL